MSKVNCYENYLFLNLVGVVVFKNNLKFFVNISKKLPSRTTSIHPCKTHHSSHDESISMNLRISSSTLQLYHLSFSPTASKKTQRSVLTNSRFININERSFSVRERLLNNDKKWTLYNEIPCFFLKITIFYFFTWQVFFSSKKCANQLVRDVLMTGISLDVVIRVLCSQ